MIRATLAWAALAAATLISPSLSAQEKPKPKAKAVKAMRLVAASTQTKSQAELKELFAKKLALPWVANAPWITDFAAAKAAAKAKGQPVFAYFTRSYAP